jgi:HEAT repeat protein
VRTSEQQGVKPVEAENQESAITSRPDSADEHRRSATPTPPAEPTPDSEVARLVSQLSDESAAERSEAAYQLGKIGSKAAPAAEALAKLLGQVEGCTLPSTGNRTTPGESAGEALGRIGEPAVPALLEKVPVENAAVKANAAAALGMIGEPAVGPLIELLDTDSSWTHNAVAKAMKAIGDPAVAPLVESLKSAGSLQTRRGAAVALGEMSCKDAVEELIAALEDESRLVRFDAAIAL